MADSKDVFLACEPVWKKLPEGIGSQHFLTVDDTKRPKAISDPGNLHICVIPEITITGEDGTNDDCKTDDSISSLSTSFSRPRSNTCPEEMFQARKGRPPTPPPVDVHKFRNPAGKRFSFNFTSKDISVSFAHHRLSKVKEEKPDQHQRTSGISTVVSSIVENTRDHCVSSKSCQIQVDSISCAGGNPSHLNTTDSSSCDVCACNHIACLTGECSSSKTNHDNEIPAASNENDSKVNGCSIESCRS
ncbi:hypothetical protein BsWGS_04642 [Bradybaena similaris]